jgi:hypothetical protein
MTGASGDNQLSSVCLLTGTTTARPLPRLNPFQSFAFELEHPSDRSQARVVQCRRPSR